jgi:membrane protease YdiL (CAAX protease family)
MRRRSPGYSSSVDSVEVPGPPHLQDTLKSPIVRLFAAFQVILVSGIPTQMVVFIFLIGNGSAMGTDGSTLTVDPAKISLQFFAMTSLLDTALIAILIRVFLAVSGESSHDVFLGRRRVAGEIKRGLLLIPLLWVAVIAIMFVITTWLPWLHNVPKNPYESYMDTPLKAGIFIVVVILAGGVREELQRAFIIYRFEQSLGGAWLGLALYSIVFGLFHLQQGVDVALVVGGMGLLWGILYIRRRSAVTAIVSHAGFDVLQIVQQVLLKTFVR